MLLWIAFFVIVMLFVANDSRIARELRIYNVLSERPYLVREFILQTHTTFK